MYGTILVPLDGSKRAESILPHAEELALRHKARVVLMKVEEKTPMLFHDEAISAEKYLRDRELQREKINTYLKTQQQILNKKGITADTSIGTGSVVKSILDLAEAEQVDLIAMASHGWGGMGRTFYGSVASWIINRTDRPLLLIRSRRKD